MREGYSGAPSYGIPFRARQRERAHLRGSLVWWRQNPTGGPMEAWPGTPYPLGATFDGSGTNFAIFSEGAERVELCLFEDDGTETRVELVDVDAHVWHAYLRQVQPGQKYGYRMHGVYDAHAGRRFNANKVLLGPYAKA